MAMVPGFGGGHTVWGELADEESMRLAERLVGFEVATNLKPGQMRMLEDPIPFTVVPTNTAT